MEKIPERFLSPANERQALANIRQWLSSGLTVEAMATQITRRYPRCRPATKKYLGKLLASIYDFETPKTAAECAELFGHKVVDGLSVSESLAIEDSKPKERVFRLLDFDESVSLCDIMGKPFPHDKWPMVLTCGNDNMVLTLNEDHNIYAFRDSDCSITIFIVDNCDKDILVDEEPFNDEEPLYFTESTHFISPVFKVRIVKNILDYILEKIGYPRVDINIKVVFSHPGAFLINRDEYEEGGCSEDGWRGVEVLTMSSILPCHAFSSVTRFLTVRDADSDSPACDLSVMLINALQATSMLYELAWRHGVHKSLDRKALERLAKEYNIFTRP